MAAPRNPNARLVVGGLLYLTLMAIGALIIVLLFVVEPLSGTHREAQLDAMLTGALLAFPALAVYLWLPWVIDRFDPEPWWCLVLALLWGGVAAIGFSSFINLRAMGLATAIASGTTKEATRLGELVAYCVSAPLVEEFWKGVGVFGFFYFLHREFDGVVDGIIYATFCALGFAATENVIYYSQAQLTEVLDHQQGALHTAFMLRGVLTPWGHPLYTSMTGIGFGIARETTNRRLRWGAPLLGYAAAVLLHAVWNTALNISGMLVKLMLPLWLLFVVAFFCLICWLVVRKGRIIRFNLRDEVALGTLTPKELELISSPFGRLKAMFGEGGSAGRRFVAQGARLGLAKWHVSRAAKTRLQTISTHNVTPLRQELGRLRGEMQQRRRPPSGG